MFIFLLIVIAVVVVFFIIKRTFKLPKYGNMTLVTGGIKTGKTTMSVWLATRQYNKVYREWFIYDRILYPALHKLPFRKCRDLKRREKPLFYSSIPIAIKNYVPLTHDLIQRQSRFAYKSVVYVCESSLLADSQCIKNSSVNESMLLFNKLFAHETRGGYVFYDTQSINDNHYAVKRCLSSYFYIHHSYKLPFFVIAKVRELKYSDDNTSINTFDSDVENSLLTVVIPKRVWKYFDCYCFSSFTDDLPVVTDVQRVNVNDRKKVKKIVSFRKYETLPDKYVSSKSEVICNEENVSKD